MNKTLLIIYTLFLFSFAKAQDSIPKISYLNSLKPAKLSHLLSKNASTDREKVYNIYSWICTNIKRDINEIEYKNEASNSIKEILLRRKAGPKGYAALFNALCKYANIESQSIPGYLKKTDYQIPENFINANHVWNAAFYDNTYHLLDCTYGAGDICKRPPLLKKIISKYFNIPVLHTKTIFIKDIDYTYFDAPPDSFIKYRVPADPLQQFLNTPIKLETYLERPTTIDPILTQYKKINYIEFAFQDTLEFYNETPDYLYYANASNRVFDFNPKNYFEPALLLNKAAKSTIGYAQTIDSLNGQINAYIKAENYADNAKEKIKEAKNLIREYRDYLNDKNYSYRNLIKDNLNKYIRDNNRIISSNNRYQAKIDNRNKLLKERNKEFKKRNKLLSRDVIKNVKRTTKSPTQREAIKIKTNIAELKSNRQKINRLITENDSILSNCALNLIENIKLNRDTINANYEFYEKLILKNIAYSQENDERKHEFIKQNHLYIQARKASNYRLQKSIDEDKEIITKETTKELKDNYKEINSLIKKNKKLIIRNYKLYPIDNQEDSLYFCENNSLIEENNKMISVNTSEIEFNNNEKDIIKDEVKLLTKENKLFERELKTELLRYKIKKEYINRKYKYLTKKNKTLSSLINKEKFKAKKKKKEVEREMKSLSSE